jgi:hypothetical protein
LQPHLPATLGQSQCTAQVTAPSVVGTHNITATYNTSATYVGSADTKTLTVRFGVCVLYDQTKSHKQGSTIPVKLFLCNASGQNVSSSSTVVMATGIVKADASASGATEDSGNANPDFNFRWDSSLQANGGGYIYNLSTKPAIYSTGTWRMTFTVNGVADAELRRPVRHQVRQARGMDSPGDQNIDRPGTRLDPATAGRSVRRSDAASP